MIGCFEIPVHDLNRAKEFYERVFEVELDPGEVHGHPMAFFPQTQTPGRAGGGLAQGAPYAPADAGVLVYFDVTSIDATLERVILWPLAMLHAG